MLVAADMDLARITYDHDAALAAYARRAGGVIQALAARWLAAPRTPSPAALEAASRLGGVVREAEALRDLRQDLHDGRVYIPRQRLESAQLTLEELRGGHRSDALQAVLQQWHERLRSEIATASAQVERAERPWLRHGIVLVRLHTRLLERLRARGYDVSERIELGPLERVWIAWRAARSTV
jgi:phytoene synthase